MSLSEFYREHPLGIDNIDWSPRGRDYMPSSDSAAASWRSTDLDDGLSEIMRQNHLSLLRSMEGLKAHMNDIYAGLKEGKRRARDCTEREVGRPVREHFPYMTVAHLRAAAEGRLAPQLLGYLLDPCRFEPAVRGAGLVDLPLEQLDPASQLLATIDSVSLFWEAWMNLATIMCWAVPRTNVGPLYQAMISYMSGVAEKSRKYIWESVVRHHIQLCTPLFAAGASNVKCWQGLDNSSHLGLLTYLCDEDCSSSEATSTVQSAGPSLHPEGDPSHDASRVTPQPGRGRGRGRRGSGWLGPGGWQHYEV